MYLRFGYSQDKIIKKVEGYSHVSFDIYDTIIKRDICRNTQIFELMENELKQDGSIYADGFCIGRIKAEREDRKSVV